jgi:hypothetical protein
LPWLAGPAPVNSLIKLSRWRLVAWSHASMAPFYFFFVPCCCCCFLYHRVETDGRVIRNETTCNYRRDWRSYPYIFLFLLFIFQEKKREDRQWRPRRRRAPLPRSGSPTSCTRPAPLYGRNKSTIRVATRANRPAKHRYVTITYTLIINNKKNDGNHKNNQNKHSLGRSKNKNWASWQISRKTDQKRKKKGLLLLLVVVVGALVYI